MLLPNARKHGLRFTRSMISDWHFGHNSSSVGRSREGNLSSMCLPFRSGGNTTLSANDGCRGRSGNRSDCHVRLPTQVKNRMSSRGWRTERWNRRSQTGLVRGSRQPHGSCPRHGRVLKPAKTLGGSVLCVRNFRSGHRNYIL